MDKNRKFETKINIGKKGLTKAIIKEINNRKIKYEVIKIKVLKNTKDNFEDIVKCLKKQFNVKRVIGHTIEILGEKYGCNKFSKTRNVNRENSRRIEKI